MTTVVLPAWMNELTMLLAQLHAKHVGGNAKTIQQKFLTEAYMESLTAHLRAP